MIMVLNDKQVSGSIVAVGESCTLGFQISEPVCALLLGGGYAEFCVVDERTVIRAFSSVKLFTMAAIPEAFMTAYQLCYLVAKMEAGESLLLHAAASSIGQAAIQMAVRKGIKVFATSRSAEKCSRCLALGASGAVVVDGDCKFADKIKELNEGSGIDVILDPVGSAYIGENLNLIAVDGRIVLYGLMTGGAVNDPAFLGKIMSKRVSVLSSTLRGRPVEYKEKLISLLRDDPAGFPAIASGDIRVDISATYPLNEVKEAHKYMAENQNIGKILMHVSSSASAAEALAKELEGVATRNGL